MKYVTLPSARTIPWKGTVSTLDGLPVRESGEYIDQKHSRLEYYSNMFAGGMKNKWPNRVYLELYAGPGRCKIRETGKEEVGSPLKVLDLNFTRFIFVEREEAHAQALAKRIENHPRVEDVEIWNGDNFQALDQISIPSTRTLTFSFVDPTGLVEINLIKKLKQIAVKGDVLINLMDSMGIKMNWHYYRKSIGSNCKLTRLLGSDEWKEFRDLDSQQANAKIQELFRAKLEALGYLTEEYNVPVMMNGNNQLYRLVFAAGDQLGIKFWRAAVKGTTPQTDFFDQL